MGWNVDKFSTGVLSSQESHLSPLMGCRVQRQQGGMVFGNENTKNILSFVGEMPTPLHV
jgi:hypothetical protein